MNTVAVTLIGKPDCHLCDAARETIAAVVEELDGSPRVTVTELSIFDDEDLMAKYVEEVPVVLIEGRVHNIWRVDPARFRSALLEASQ